MFVDLSRLPSTILLQARFDLKVHFSSDFFGQIFNVLPLVVTDGHEGALKLSLVGDAISGGFLRYLKRICIGALQQQQKEQLMNCVAIFKLLQDVERKKNAWYNATICQ